MILSKKFVSNYIDVKSIDIKTIAEDMTRVGNEYDYAGKLVNATNLVVGHVLECEMHPDSDHLHVCKIDVGDEVLDIVCGAPNMRKGLKVIVAKDGAVLPGGTIKKGVIRGAISNGMCCSLEELGLDKKFLNEMDINGIHELPSDAPVGMDALEYLGLDDEIVDFELTANRSDLLSMIGLAYELGAVYGKPVNEPTPVYESVKDTFLCDVNLSVDTDNCSLYLLGRVNNVTIKESPDYIKNALIASSIRPINNVVDISNYVMLETGQPLHFYDADKVGKLIGVRMANNEEVLTTLDKTDRELTTNDIVIYNESGPIGLAGVMGGFSTEVTKDTKNILIESAIFTPGVIRKTAKRILRSEASSRFEKGLDYKRTYLAINRSKELLSNLAGGTVSEGLIIYDKVDKSEKHVLISLEKINSVLGLCLTKEDVVNVLNKLKFSVNINNDEFDIIVPSRRLDVSIKEDIIEEIGRIYGVDEVPITLPSTNNGRSKYDNYDRIIKTKLSDMGLNETITYSLINKKDINKFVNEEFTPVEVMEPLNSERSTLRNSLISSLINVYEYNKSRNIKNVSIFEIGSCYSKVENDYVETSKLAILMSGEFITGINTSVKIDFYYLKGVVESLLDYLGYKGRYSFVSDVTIKEMHPYMSANIILNGLNVGFIGKVHPLVNKEDLYVCEINLSTLRSVKAGKIKFKELSKYPSIKKDISFIFSDVVVSDNIIKDIRKLGGKTLTEVVAYDEYIMGKEKSLTFTLNYMSEERTLTEEEVMASFNNIINGITVKYNAKLKHM